MKDLLDKLDKRFENRIRLGIMSLLVVNRKVDFVTLRDSLEVSDGNLASHLQSLEKAGYLTVKKSFVGRKPQTTYAASKKGIRAFELHLDALEKIIKGVDD